MTVFIPTTLVNLYRLTDTDEFGDPTDDNTVITYSDLPSVITEKTQRTFLPEELRLDIVQKYTIRLRPGTDVQEGDRLRDQYSDSVYQVQEVYVSPTIVAAGDIRVSAVKVANKASSSKTSRK